MINFSPENKTLEKIECTCRYNEMYLVYLGHKADLARGGT